MVEMNCHEYCVQENQGMYDAKFTLTILFFHQNHKLPTKFLLLDLFCFFLLYIMIKGSVLFLVTYCCNLRWKSDNSYLLRPNIYYLKKQNKTKKTHNYTCDTPLVKLSCTIEHPNPNCVKQLKTKLVSAKCSIIGLRKKNR